MQSRHLGLRPSQRYKTKVATELCGWARARNIPISTFLNSDSKTCILAWFALHDTYFSTVLEEYLIHGLKMFWKFDLHPSSAIDTMLTREVSLIFVCIRFAISSRNFFLFCVTFYYLLKSFFSRTVLWAKYWTKMMCCKRQNRRIESWSTCK